MSAPEPPAFSLRVQGDRAALLLTDETLFGWLRLDRLELEITDAEFPIDVAGGAARFQRRRCRVEEARLSVDDAALEALVWARAAALAQAGFDEITVRALEGSIEIAGRARTGGRGAEFTAHAYLEPAGRGVRVALGELRVFGWLAKPTPLLGHELLVALASVGKIEGGEVEVGDEAHVHGLGDLELRPLDAALWGALPPRGWRLPDVGLARLITAAATRGRIELGWSRVGELVKEGRAAAALGELRAADARLLRGDLDGAIAAYRGEVARAQAPGLALERLLGVLVAREETLAEAEQTARDALVRWKGLVPAHLALGAVHVSRGRFAEAAADFARVLDEAEAAGDDDQALRAAVASARLLSAVDPARATPFWERALARRPAHAEAAEALAARYTDDERWQDLARLSRRRIAATGDPREQAREHLRLGEVFLARLDDPEKAREELLRATRLDEADPRGWDALGRALASLGDGPGAVRALDRVVQLHAAKGDAVGEARGHARIGALWEAQGDDDSANQRYRRAIEILPEDEEVLERLAVIAARRGQPAEARAAWARLVELGGAATGRRAARELARLLVADGELDRARQILEAAAGDEAFEVDRLRVVADVDEAAGELASAADTLGRAAALTDGEAAAALELRRAMLLDRAGAPDLAARVRERAIALAPSGAGLEAARGLAEAARAAGDAAAEARWLDALIAAGAGDDDLATRRARLALAAGDAARAREVLAAGGAPSNTRRRLEADVALALGDAAGGAAALDEVASASTDPLERADAGASASGAWLAAKEPARALASGRAAVEASAGEATWRALVEAAWQARSWADVVEAARPLLAAAASGSAASDLPANDASAAAASGVSTAASDASAAVSWAASGAGAAAAASGVSAAASGSEISTNRNPPTAAAGVGGQYHVGLTIGIVARRLGEALERIGASDDDALAAYRAAADAPDARGEALAFAWRRTAELTEKRGDGLARAGDDAGARAAWEAGAAAFARAATDARTGEPAAARAELHLRAADLLRKRLAQPERAAEELEAALRVAPEHLPSLDALEAISADAGDGARVAAILGRKIAATARHPERQKALLVRLAEAQLALGRADVAREAYRRALELDPAFRPALSALAPDARARGDLAEAETLYARLADPAGPGAGDGDERAAALVALAELARASGRLDDAERRLAAAVTAAPGRDDLYDRLEEVYVAGQRWTDLALLLGQRAERARPDARYSLERRRIKIIAEKLGDWRGAIAACEDAIARSPEELRLWKLLAQAALDAKETAVMARALEEVARLEKPEHKVGALVGAARAQIAAGDPDKGRALLEQADGLEPDGEALSELFDLARARGDVVELATLLGRRKLADPRRHAALSLERARLYLSKEDADGALAALADVAAGDADDELLALRADLREEQGAWRDVARDLAELGARHERAGDRERELAVTRRFAAITLERLHDDREAERLYERALALDPDDLAAAAAVADLRARRGDGGEARAALERVLAVARATDAGPAREAEILGQLARGLALAGDLEGARARIEEALGVAPRDTLALREAVILARRAGDDLAAGRHLDALAAGAHDPEDVRTLQLEIAEHHEKLGDRTRVLDALRKASEAAPADEALAARVARLAAQAPSPDELIAQARAAAEADPAAARALAREAAAGVESDDPRWVEVTRMVISSSRALGDRVAEEQALGHLRVAGAADADDLARVGALLLEREDFGGAADVLADALRGRARDLVAAGQSFDADGRAILVDLRGAAHAADYLAPLADGLCAAAAAEADGAVAAAWFAEAATLRRGVLGDDAGAIDALGLALALRPSDASLVDELAGLLAAAGEHARLLEVYDAHLATLLDERRAPVLYALGRIWADAFGDLARAASLFALAHASDPAFLHVLLPLAEFHYGEDEPGPAEDYYGRALAAGMVRPEDQATVLSRMADLALRRGDASEAVARFRQALERDPRVDGGLAGLDGALRAAGEWDEVARLLVEQAAATGVGTPEERLLRAHHLREAARVLDGPLHHAADATPLWAEVAELDPDDTAAAERAAGGAPEVELDDEDISFEDDGAGGPTHDGRESFDWGALRQTIDADAARAAEPVERARLLVEAARLSSGQLKDLGGAAERLGAAAELLAGVERARLEAERAELLSRADRIDDARVALAAALEDAPIAELGPLAQLALGRIRLADANPEGALASLVAAADTPDLAPAIAAEAHRLAGDAHQALGQTDAAMARYEHASALDPFDMRACDALAAIGEARADYDLLAEILGRRILVCDDNSQRARLWVRRAMLYRDVLHREPEAYRCFKEAFANDPNLIEASHALRAMAMARGEWALCAELLYREIDGAKTAADKAALHLELALVFEERLHDVEQAIRNADSALALDPASGAAAQLARLHPLVGRFAEAARNEELTALLERSPAGRAARLLRAGEHHERAGAGADARRLYTAAAKVPGGGEAAAIATEKAARFSSDEGTAARAGMRARLTQTEDPAEKLALLQQLLAAAAAAGDDEEVDVRARELLAREPADLNAFLLRRRQLTGRGDFVALAELFRERAEALADGEEKATLFFDLGRIAQRLGDATRAQAAFEAALHALPGHAPSIDALADAAYRAHEWERAFKLYARLEPDASRFGADVVHFRRGELAEMLGHAAIAEAAYHAAVAANPSHLAALEALARLALYRGEPANAIAALRSALELLPLDDVERITSARQQLGELCQRAGDLAAARGYYELVLVEEPGRLAALAPLAELYATAGIWPSAAQALARLSYLLPTPEKRAETLFRLGEIYRLQIGDDAKASDAYLKAIDLDPRHAPTMRRLVDYYWSVADDAGLLEIAHELDGKGELASADTTPETIARASVCAALAGEIGWGRAVAGALGDAAAGAIAAMLADAAARRPRDLDAVAQAARALCAPPGPALDAVKSVLVMRATRDASADLLAARL